ncbi:CGNR zinc finger domain-containing protein [Actinomadura sediminis]|uniref:CGNR zinc finger domain-containing protein n=1 Tax=Actinomadura sediminis TaxID=1038904 RepID=A0ABW3EPF5_9ACTN
MDLASYADLAVDLVNTRRPHIDELHDLDALRALLADRPHFTGRVARRDLDAMRELRGLLRAIFEAAADGGTDDAVRRLNTLLIRQPIHPQIVRHDDGTWHLHCNEHGSVPDRYAARAAMGLAAEIDAHGVARLGLCRSRPCGRAFYVRSPGADRRYCSVRCAARARASAAPRSGPPRVTVPHRDGGQ